jgi:hypothetical protein
MRVRHAMMNTRDECSLDDEVSVIERDIDLRDITKKEKTHCV